MARTSSPLRLRRSPRFVPTLHQLEDRCNPANIVITTLADTVAVDGQVSLREAIQSINAGANINADVTASNYGSGGDFVRFTTGLAGTITLTSDLDIISKQVSIQGNLSAGVGSNPTITVSGNNKQFATFRISGPNVGISRLSIVGSSADGILISGAGATGARVQANHIGIDATGTTAGPNGASGVTLDTGASGALIGGVLGQDTNVISGNTSHGITFQGAPTKNNVVSGNYIGTNAAGTAAVPNGQDGVFIAGSTGNTIGGASDLRNVISGNGLDGIGMQGATVTNNVIQGNYIGTNAAGTAALGNAEAGISLFAGPNGNTIGGTAPGARNVISGNRTRGITINGVGTSNNLIQGNFIGTDVTGTTNFPGGFNAPSTIGVEITNNASNNVVGGGTAAARNVISGNSTGVTISRNASGNRVQGNFIGTNAAGTAANNQGTGVVIATGASNNSVGGFNPGEGNLIAFNSIGVSLLTAFGQNSGFQSGNAILGNSIFSNRQLGIDLGSIGVTANDASDADAGPNGLQNYPVITGVVGDVIYATLHSTPNESFRIEFFLNDARDPSGFGEGQTFLNSLGVITDANGNATFTFNAANLTGKFVSATATNLTTNNTSEFSNTVLGIATPTPQLIPTPTPIQVPQPQPKPIPQAVPVLAPPLVATSGTPLLFPTPGGPTVATGVPTFTTGDIAPTAGGPHVLPPKAVLAVSQAAGGSGMVRVYNADGSLRVEAAVFPGFAGGIRIGTADVNGDGVPDGIAAAGAGGGPHVKVFSGVDGSELMSFFAYDASFRGGLFVAGGDLNGDGHAEIITGAGFGGGPHVKVFDGATGQELASFFAFDPSFTGGVTVAAGDLNNDGLLDVVVGAGAGGGPHVKVAEATSLRQVQANGQIADSALLASYFAYDPAFTGGVFVSAGADMNFDGLADVVTGAGAGGGPHVKVFDTARMGAKDATGVLPDGTLLASFFAFEREFRGGVRVGEADAVQDGVNELILGAGPTGGPRVRVLRTTDLSVVSDFFAFDPAFTGGVFVD